MYEKSLGLNEALGRKEGMANQYGNLGIVYQTRGELDRAVEMYEKSLEIEEALGRKEGMASDYGNLGIVYQTRGELDRAVEMYEKSLGLNEALGRPRFPATSRTSPPPGRARRGSGRRSRGCRTGWPCPPCDRAPR